MESLQPTGPAIQSPSQGLSLGSPNSLDTQPSHSPLAGGARLNGGSCSNDIPGQQCGNPINNTTGNRFETEADYQGTGVFPLVFERYYNSLGQESGGFGAHWTHSYSSNIKSVSSTQVDVIRPDQKVLTFQLSNGVWQTTADINGTLSQTGGQWLYRTGDDQVETYEASGRLVSIANRNGVRQTLTYDALSRLAAVSDPTGKSLTFSYDAANRIVGMIDPGSGTYSYGYDSNNQLVSVSYPDTATRQYQYANVAPDGSQSIIVMKALIDELGKTYASWTYDSDGTAKSSQHAGGADAVNLSRFNNGSVVADSNGTVSAFSYQNIHGRWQTVAATESQPGVGSANVTQTWSYDANGNVTSHTNKRGITTTYTYDTTRNLETSRTEAVGTPQARTITTAWHASMRLPTAVVEPNRTRTWQYDSQGNVLSRKDTANGITRNWTYTYNANGQVLTVKEPRTDVNAQTTFAYDNAGNLKSVTNALGQITRYTQYDANGRLLSSTDANGLIRQYTYDARGRLTILQAGALTTRFIYDQAGQLRTVSYPDGSSLSNTYDDAHRLIKVTDDHGSSIAYTLNASGARLFEQTLGSNNQLSSSRSFAFDTLGRLVSSTGAQGQKTSFGYDLNENLTSVTDPLGHTLSMGYDALDRRSSSTDPAGAIIQYAYDLNDHLTQVTDPRGLVTDYSYNGFGDRIGVNSPDSGVTRTRYDLAGNVLNQTDANGRLASYRYDALNRPIDILYAGTMPTHFSYDQGVNGIGHLTGMTDVSGATSWTYDALGHVVGHRQITNGKTLSLQYGYDAKGRLVSVTYPSGTLVNLSYDSNRITDIAVNGAEVLSSIQYRPLQNQPESWAWGNGSPYQRSFDNDGRLTAYPLGARTRQVNYDSAGQIIGYSDSDTTKDQSFAYDAVGRLTQFSKLTGSLDYSYDETGNRTALGSSFAGDPSNTSYTISPTSNQLTSLSSNGFITRYQYDRTGNTRSDGKNRFAYDGRNRLIQASNTQGQNYFSINGLGQRVAKLKGTPPDLAGDANHDSLLNSTDLRLIALMINRAIATDFGADCNHDNKVTTADVACVQAKIADMRVNPQKYNPAIETLFVYDEAGHLVGEYDANGAPIQETVWLNDLPVAVIKGGQTYYVYADQINTPRAISNNANNVVWEWDSEPFGTALPNQDPDGNGVPFVYNLRFPGQYYDSSTGLHYNYFRDYKPAIGRYIQSDPIGLAGGIGTYTYVIGNPLIYSDSYGLFKFGPGGFSFDCFQHHGNWCGPSWTGGHWEEYDTYHDSIYLHPYLQPIDSLDMACQLHDIAYFDCRKNYPGPSNYDDRAICMTKADRQLAHRAAGAGYKYSLLWSWMRFNIYPSPGGNRSKNNVEDSFYSYLQNEMIGWILRGGR